MTMSDDDIDLTDVHRQAQQRLVRKALDVRRRDQRHTSSARSRRLPVGDPRNEA
jgi:hypothetical protein